MVDLQDVIAAVGAYGGIRPAARALGIPESTLRIRYQKALLSSSASRPEPLLLHSNGNKASDTDIDEEAVWRRAVGLYDKAVKKAVRPQSLEFSGGPICLVFMADLHLGSKGTDYARIDRDIDLITNAAGMWIWSVGDEVDNYIIGRLQGLRKGTPFTITEEWVMFKRVMLKMGPRLLAMCTGNHNIWVETLAGIDYTREVMANLNPGVLYAKYDQVVSVSVGGHEYRIRARHHWGSTSMYNPTHGIEKASKFDKGRHFDIGIAAHTHASGVFRQFNNGGKTGAAILCGAYKRFDEYADMLGCPEPNESAAVALILDGQGGMLGTNNLESAAAYMKTMYPR